ncbi:hypothetical protein FSP39_013344, partial [Pinctada imbricata]
EILQNKGGSSVDAAIAVMVCYGVVNPMSSGLGGGFFMNIYDRAFFSLSMEYSVKGRAYGIDARETAPAKATKDMFSNRREISQLGGLSIGVPGEVKGYEEAHKLYGKLPWKELFQPSIDLARKGFNISENLASCLKQMEKNVVRDPDLRTAFTNPKTGTLLKTGDRTVLPKLADTMQRIATEGANSFYSGRLSYDVAKDLKEKGFKMAPMILKRKTEKLLAYHRIVEAFKFAYAKRTYLGDQRFNENNNITSLLTSREYANFIRLRISDRTYHPNYYGPSYYGRSSGGTAHLSIVGHDNLAVSATTTINLKFGSGVMGSRTGLIFNDVMDDFSSPKFVNAFGLPPSPANFISPGKRPLSSMCPVIIVDKKGSVTMHWMLGFSLVLAALSAIIASVVLSCFGKLDNNTGTPRASHPEQPIGYKLAAIATENELCTDIARECFTNPETGQSYKEGEILKLPKLARTMEIIAEKGANAFYNGILTEDILEDLQEKGSIITNDDLKHYKAEQVTPLNITLENGSTVFALPPPSSGPVLQFFLNIMDGFNKSEQRNKEEMETQGYHRIVEALKFSHAKRTHLGDRKFTDLNKIIRNLVSRQYADTIRSKIRDDKTHNVDYYGPVFHDELKAGTAHVSIVGPDNIAVAATNSINLWFGSGVMGQRTGLLFNDAMDDFSSPNITDANFVPPFVANFIKPGKRPLSTRCPTIIVDKKGEVKIVIGAAGGSRIVSATAFVLARMLWFDDSMREALDHPRIHHQLVPSVLYHDPRLQEIYIKELRQKGHEIKPHPQYKSFVNGIVKEGDLLMPHCDKTRPGCSTTGL